MNISYTTSLPNDNPHAVEVDIVTAFYPIPVKLNVIELNVVAIITNESKDFNIAVIVLYFFYFLFDLWFLSLKYVINSLMLLIWLIKLSQSFIFFQSLF